MRELRRILEGDSGAIAAAKIYDNDTALGEEVEYAKGVAVECSDSVENLRDFTEDMNDRVRTLEGMAQIVLSGGTYQIATASDFEDYSTESRSRIPSVGSIQDFTDNTLTYNSKKFARSGEVYEATKLSNVDEFNDFVVDIVMKSGHTLSDISKITIDDVYQSGNIWQIRLAVTSGSTTVNLIDETYTTSDEAVSAYTDVFESEYCYAALRHVENAQSDERIVILTDGDKLSFFNDISWESRTKHPIIYGKLLKDDIEALRTDIEDQINTKLAAIENALADMTTFVMLLEEKIMRDKPEQQ